MGQEEVRPAERIRLTGGGAPLTREEIDRLTAYKWRYTLEARGFTRDQAGRLMFIKWLYRQGVVSG